MKTTIPTGYRADLMDLCEALSELMADLEDVRDEAQEMLDDQENPAVREDVRRMDEALRLLSQAADLMETEEA